MRDVCFKSFNDKIHSSVAADLFPVCSKSRCFNFKAK